MFDRKVQGKTVIFMHLKVLGEIPVASGNWKEGKEVGEKVRLKAQKKYMCKWYTKPGYFVD